MKKWLICLTVLFSTFLFTNKVSALETTSGSFPDIPEGFDSFVIIERPSDSGYRLFAWNSANTVYVHNHMDSAFYFSLSATSANNISHDYVKTYNLSNNNWEYYKTSRNMSWSFKNVIASTVDIINDSDEMHYEAGYGLVDNFNNFKEIINSTQYSKVEFIFDIPNKETNFNFNYDFHLVDSNGNLDTLNTFKSPYFEETYTSCSVDENGIASCKPLPVVDNYVIKNASEDDGQCHLDEFGLNNCYKPNDYSNNEELNISNSYVVKNYDMAINNNILTKMTSKLKLIIDLEFNPSVYIDASFTSSLPFEVKYYERTTTTDYYSTVDITGKYGALFMPKFDNLDDTLNIRTLFKGDGHLDIQHRSSIDLIDYKILSAYSMNYCNEYLYNQDNIPYSCSEYSGEFEFYVSNNNLEQGLFFVNSHFDNDNSATATITYDTRYYVYWVFDTPSSIVPVENPNTGDKEYISLDGFYNYADVDPGFLESLFNKFTDQLYDTFPVIQQFLMVINLFDYNEEYDEAPKLMVSLDSIGIDQEVQIVDFGVFHEHRATVIFWEMLVITTITIYKVTDYVVRAMKD